MEEKNCRLTLVGPREAVRRSLLKLGPWTRREWRRVVVDIEVGSEQFPTWDTANVCVQAIQDLLKMNDGLLSDTVLQALQTHVKVISMQSFRGPA